jgi:hypothetical protein
MKPIGFTSVKDRAVVLCDDGSVFMLSADEKTWGELTFVPRTDRQAQREKAEMPPTVVLLPTLDSLPTMEPPQLRE